MYDCIGQDIKVGDYAVCVRGNLPTFNKGSVYKIGLVDTVNSRIIIEDHVGDFSPGDFIKINSYANNEQGQLDFNLIADKIIQLINSKPWTPSKEQVVNELKFWSTVRDGKPNENSTKAP